MIHHPRRVPATLLLGLLAPLPTTGCTEPSLTLDTGFSEPGSSSTGNESAEPPDASTESSDGGESTHDGSTATSASPPNDDGGESSGPAGTSSSAGAETSAEAGDTGFDTATDAEGGPDTDGEGNTDTEGGIPGPAFEALGRAEAARDPVVFGDFDGDGLEDVARGEPGHGGAGCESGAVHVRYGKQADGEAPETWIPGRQGLVGEASCGAAFAAALATADLDLDGHDDLFVGAPGTTVDGAANAGAIYVILGGPAGLDPGRDQRVTPDAVLDGWTGNPLTPLAGARFGASVAAGDFWCSLTQVVVGAPGAEVAGAPGAGSLFAIMGNEGVLQPQYAYRYDRDLLQGPGTAAAGDGFGSTLVAANLDLDDVDGYACTDLAVGVPGATVDGEPGAGAAYLLYGDPGTDQAPDAFLRHQALDQHAIGSEIAEAGDHFGAAIVVELGQPGDFPELIVFAPDERLSADERFGASHRLRCTVAGCPVDEHRTVVPRTAELAAPVVCEAHGEGFLCACEPDPAAPAPCPLDWSTGCHRSDRGIFCAEPRPLP